MMNKECVVTFKNESRTVAMYFKEEDGNLDMQMSITPEFKPTEEDPDLPILLASTFLQTLNIENKDEFEPEKPVIVS